MRSSTASGITFAVYGEGGDTERLIPFDIIPRIIPQDEWRTLEAGLKQRVRTLNAFIHDIYLDQNILKAGIVPAEHLLCNAQYRPEMQGIDVPGGIYAHIAGRRRRAPVRRFLPGPRGQLRACPPASRT